jgi:predicted RNase H-like HicB family nuclease
MTKYSMRVAWSDADGMFVATCPELGDLSALGATQQKAAAELVEAIELALETCRDEGKSVPEPNLVHAYSGQFRTRLPRSLHAWLVEEAEREGVSLNTLVTMFLSGARGDNAARGTGTTKRRSALAGPRAPLPTTARSAKVARVSDATSRSRASARSSPRGAKSKNRGR